MQSTHAVQSTYSPMLSAAALFTS